MNVENLLGLPLHWDATGDGEHPYRCEVDGTQYVVRINDFPAEPLYSVMAGGRVLGNIDDWPPGWQRPGHR